MANLPTKIVLFFSSYAPLFLLLLVRHKIDNRLVLWTLVAVAIGSVAVLIVYLRMALRLTENAVVATNVLGKDSEAMSYLFTYILPFLDVRLDEPRTVASLLIVFAILGIIYVNSNMLYINPVLNLMGLHIFEVQLADGKNCALIARRTYIRPGATVTVVPLSNYVLLEKRDA